jgi:hypothetical protein
VKAELGVLESDSRDDAAGKLERSVADLVDDDDGERRWLECELAPLVGLLAESVDRQQRFGGWRRSAEALAERRPLVLVSKICSGRTTSCMISSTSSRSGRRACRC